ncbi:hypothetical protein Hanom_Chr06g00482441 [Helianthus anomalus]
MCNRSFRPPPHFLPIHSSDSSSQRNPHTQKHTLTLSPVGLSIRQPQMTADLSIPLADNRRVQNICFCCLY